MSILSEAFFALMGRHFVSFMFFTVWHDTKILNSILLEFADKCLGWLECRNAVFRNDD